MFCDPRPRPKLSNLQRREKQTNKRLRQRTCWRFWFAILRGNNNYNSARENEREGERARERGTAIKYTTWQQVQLNEYSSAIYHARQQPTAKGVYGIRIHEIESSSKSMEWITWHYYTKISCKAYRYLMILIVNIYHTRYVFYIS